MDVTKQIKSYTSFIIASFAIFCSCTVVKKYKPGQPFVFENKVNVKGIQGQEEKSDLRDALAGQVEDSVQPRIKDIIFLFHSLKNPPRYDTLAIIQSTLNMKNLMLVRGYRNAEVAYDTTVKMKKDQLRVTVNYNVEAGKLYRIDSIAYNLADSNLQQIAKSIRQGSLVKKGNPFDYNVIDQERSRLVDAFHNRGYYKFSLDDLYALADSSYPELLNPNLDPFEYIQLLSEVEKKRQHPTIDVYFRQRQSEDSTRFKQYHIGNFTVYPDATADINLPTQDTVQHWVNGVKVVSAFNTFDPSFIEKNIMLKPDSLYRDINYSKTLNNFNRLGAWQNINIFSAANDSLRQVNYLLKLTPAKKQYFSVDLEGSTLLNTAEVNQVGKGKIGLAVNFTLRNRNIGKKAIQLENILRTGIEFNNFEKILSGEVSLSNRLIIPWLVTPFRIRGASQLQSRRSVIAADLSYIDRFQFYKIQSFNTFLGYEWKPKPNTTWQFKPLNIEATFVQQDSGFVEAIKDFPLLIYSYNNGLVLGMNGSYFVSFNPRNANHISTLRIYGEESGLLFGTLFNNLTAENKALQNLFKFLKFDVDFRHYIKFKKSTLAFRAFAGYGKAFETKTKQGEVTLPFFKSYFSGGPNSMRGWQIRKLGIGQNIHFDTVQNGSFNDKYADVQLEANLEYRFNLFPIYGVWMRGAVFTDVGNIWYRNTLDGQFPKSNFEIGRVFEDLALDAGFGVRVDFKYFIIRFDLGYPLKDPRYGPDKTDDRSLPFYSPNKGGWFVDNHWNKSTFQFAIGYPF